MAKLRCALFATPEIANECLVELNQNENIELALVVSMPDRPAGRGKKLKSPEIVNTAKDLGIEVIQTPNINKSEEFEDWSKKNELDLIIVFAFAQFLGSKILNFPNMGCFNIHTSLLPKYRGAAPMQYALFNGDTTTGITIQRMVKEMDAGNIVETEEISIEANDNLGTLHDKFKSLSPKVLNRFLSNIVSGELSETIQNSDDATFAPSIPKEDTLLDFEVFNNIVLHNKVRGLSPIPCAYLFINSKRAKIYETEISDLSLKVGEVNTQFNSIIIGTREGSLRLKTIQLEGRSRNSDVEIINGFKNSGKSISISKEKV